MRRQGDDGLGVVTATAGVLLTAAAIAAAVAGRRLVGRAGRRVLGAVARRWGAGGHDDPARWRVVTVYRPEQSMRDHLPAPLAELGDGIEVRIRAAPGDKGTELAARLSASHPGAAADGAGAPPREDVRQALQRLRAALRQSKQVAEVGWTHQANINSTTTPTPFNAPLRKLLRQAGGEGRL